MRNLRRTRRGSTTVSNASNRTARMIAVPAMVAKIRMRKLGRRGNGSRFQAFHLQRLCDYVGYRRLTMTASSIGKHAAGGTATDQPPVPEPAFAERARTLMYLGRIGSLSTLSRKQPGFPFGSVMPYGLDDRGRPVFLISTMAMHTQNLQADPRASLLVTQDDGGGDPLGASRVTLVGNVSRLPEAETPEARELYLARYANSKYWVDFEDFSFYR